MSRLSTPVLLALVAVLGLGNALTSPAVHADGDGELAPTVMPSALPPTAFLTGGERLDTATLDGLEVRLERAEGDLLAAVIHNPGSEPRRFARNAEVVITEGSMASRMGPMPRVVANVPIAVEVAPGQTMRKVFGGVALQPSIADFEEGQEIPAQLFMSFQSVEVAFDGERLALVEAPAAPVAPTGNLAPNVDLDVPKTASLDRRGELKRARR